MKVFFHSFFLQETKFADVFFNGNRENPISLIDTIGWSDSGNFTDAMIIEELINKLKLACDHISLFVLASKFFGLCMPCS